MIIIDYLYQIIFIPLFTIMLIMTNETDVKIILSISIVILSILTGYSLGLNRRDKNETLAR